MCRGKGGKWVENDPGKGNESVCVPACVQILFCFHPLVIRIKCKPLPTLALIQFNWVSVQVSSTDHASNNLTCLLISYPYIFQCVCTHAAVISVTSVTTVARDLFVDIDSINKLLCVYDLLFN